MDLGSVVAQLNIPESAAILTPDWERSQVAMPKEGIPFLSGDFLRKTCRQVYLPQNMTEAVVEAAERIAREPALSALAWHGHYRLTHEGDQRVNMRDWPVLASALDRDAGMFYVVVLLSITPRMSEVHRRRKIPEPIIRDTVRDLDLCMNKEDFREDFGHWGISPRIFGWLLNHWRGELYRLGRLQFIPDTWRDRLHAFRHRSDGAVILLAGEGITFRADGQINGAGGVKDEAGAWTSRLTISDKEIVGHPIHPKAFATTKEVRLHPDEWRQELAPGDPALAIHIPAGAPMDYEACGDSIRQALDFFPRHFPDKPFAALMCHSWILDAQFEDLLPPASNLVRFQQEMYLFPIQGGTEGTVRTVFGRHVTDIKDAPRRTTMQRAFARHIESGGHFRAGGCFLLPQDFDWGAQVYRQNWDRVRSLTGCAI
ncbi:MAG: acyltransferase domain-containing protein [Planctomycetota bacterium]